MNKVIYYVKTIFLLIAFSFALYISFMKMNSTSSSILTILPVFIPFLILLILFVFGLILDRKWNNSYIDLISILAFIAIIIITIRTIFDKNIIAYPQEINLAYYDMQDIKIKMLLYLMIIGNIGLIIYQKSKNNKIHS